MSLVFIVSLCSASICRCICIMCLYWWSWSWLYHTNSVRLYLFCCTYLDGFKYWKWLNISILPIDGSLKNTSSLGQNGPGSNLNEGVLHIPQSSRTEAIWWFIDISWTLVRQAVDLPLFRKAIGVFWNPSWLSNYFSDVEQRSKWCLIRGSFNK